MSDTQQKISPQAARENAQNMANIGDQIEEILEEISRRMTEVNEEDSELYYGYKKPSELRAELDQFRGTFHLTNEQIHKSANDIVTTANVMENQ